MATKNTIEIREEIDLIELVQLIWKGRRLIVWVSIIAVTFGVAYALLAQEEYEASSRLLPNENSGASNLGSLGGLAGLAGLNLGNSNDGKISPDLYPDIVESTPFKLTLLNEPLYFQKIGKEITSYEYFNNSSNNRTIGYIREYTIGLPSKIRSFFKDKNLETIPGFDNHQVLHLTEEDIVALSSIEDRISVSFNSGDGLIYAQTKMPDPIAAAQLCKTLVENMTNEIIKFKIEKLRTNLEFIESRFNEANTEYMTHQKRVASFTQRNRNLTSPLVQIEYQRLKNDLDISFEVYKGLATQLEQAKIKVKEETPILSVIEPVIVPQKKSSPKRGLIVMVSLFFGIIASSGYLIIKYFLNIQ